MSYAVEFKILNIYLGLCAFSFFFYNRKIRGKKMSLVSNFIWL